jgi:hypothetical protein
VFIAVAVTPVSYGEFRGGHGDTVEELSHAAHGREAAVDGEHFTAGGKAKGRGAVADRGGLQFSGDDDLLTPRRYPTSQARIPTPVTRIAAEGAVGGEDSRAGGLIPIELLYHGASSSVA